MAAATTTATSTAATSTVAMATTAEILAMTTLLGCI
jgi:hypothetical protein